ncbi:transposase family protein [Candidatus Sarmatiella mevalonica]|uniref:transposase family protein n=1 Tax=Candidatus Sarmatiella mevalonica TaxID=2770581 RepID=UPI001922BA39|nr:transposase family protein [Candidatus Sarmatiella mevalonica]
MKASLSTRLSALLNDQRRAENHIILAKKRHTLKTEIRVTKKGCIVHVSKTHPGSMHDFTVFKAEKRPPKEPRLFVASGYQGITDIHQNADFPCKASKNKPLDAEEKEYNTGLFKVQVVVEHVFGDIKTFKIMADRYRNKIKRYNVKFRTSHAKG